MSKAVKLAIRSCLLAFSLWLVHSVQADYTVYALTNDFDQLLNDYNVHQEPAMAKPGYMQPYSDVAYDTLITRVTDVATAVPTPGMTRTHWYARQNPWNTDSSYFILLDKSWHLYDGQTNQWIKTLNIHYGGKAADPVWHPSDPNIIYYQYGNEVRKLDVTTNQFTTMRTFPSYNFVSTMGEGTIITDDGKMALVGMSNTSTSEAIFVYDIFTDTVGAPFSVPSGLDWAGISYSGQYVVGGWAGAGSGPSQGFTLYRVNTDLSLTFISNIYDLNKHSDFAIDTDGSDVIVIDDFSALDHIIKIKLSDQSQTEVQTGIGWTNWMHLSGRCTNRPGWVVVSTSATYQGGWIPFRDEVWAVKLDGSGEVRRIAHTHSQGHLNGAKLDYWATPRATANKDCTKVMFSSNWRDLTNNGANVEVYVVDLSGSLAVADVTVTKLTMDSVTISWSTTQPSTSQVEYGTKSGNYTSQTVLDTNMVTFHSVDITNLSPSAKYYFRVKSEAGSLALSSEASFSISGTPATSSGTGGAGGKGGCFIFTAVFGSAMADEVKVMSEFRDMYLTTNPVGRAIVRLYYSTSPPIADYIRDKELVKSLVRVGLVPLVKFSNFMVHGDNRDKLFATGFFLFIGSAVTALTFHDRGSRYSKK